MSKHATKFTDTKMDCPSNALLDKAFEDEPLTRQEKDSIASILYGTFSSYSYLVRQAGWQWNMAQAKQIRRILVSFTYDRSRFNTFYAPDKTSLKKVLPSVAEMVYPDEPKAQKEE